jgi:hypothetical protein
MSGYDTPRWRHCKVCGELLLSVGDTCGPCATTPVPPSQQDAIDLAKIKEIRAGYITGTIELINLSDSSRHEAQATRLAKALANLHNLEKLVTAAYGNKT